MAKSGFLRKMRQYNDGAFLQGAQFGYQQAADYIILALNDPEVMGKDTLGQERLRKVLEAANRNQDRYHGAFVAGPEQDVMQRNLDRALQKACGKYFTPFYERFPQIKEIKYGKAAEK